MRSLLFTVLFALVAVVYVQGQCNSALNDEFCDNIEALAEVPVTPPGNCTARMNALRAFSGGFQEFMLGRIKLINRKLYRQDDYEYDDDDGDDSSNSNSNSSSNSNSNSKSNSKSDSDEDYDGDDYVASCNAASSLDEAFKPNYVLDSLISYCNLKKQNTESRLNIQRKAKKCKKPRGKKARGKKGKKLRRKYKICLTYNKKVKSFNRANVPIKECRQLVDACASSTYEGCDRLINGPLYPTCVSPRDSLILNARTNDANGDGNVTFGELYNDLKNNYDSRKTNDGNEDGLVQRGEWIDRWVNYYKFPAGFAQLVWENFSNSSSSDVDATVAIANFNLPDPDVVLVPTAGLLGGNVANFDNYCRSQSTLSCYCSRYITEVSLCLNDPDFNTNNQVFCDAIPATA